MARRQQDAAVSLQAASRGYHARTQVGPRPNAARVLQRSVRAWRLRVALGRRVIDGKAAAVMQAAWRGSRLRSKLRAALEGAKYHDSDDDFEYEEVDDGWLDEAAKNMDDLDTRWVPSFAHQSAIDLRGNGNGAMHATLPPLQHDPAVPAMPMPLAATMGGANGVHHHHSNNGNGAAAAWAASCAVDAAAAHRQLYSADPSAQHPPQSQPQSTASSPPRHNHSSNGSYNNQSSQRPDRS